MNGLNVFFCDIAKHTRNLVVFVIFIVSLSACRNDPVLTPTERNIADSIFRVRSNEILPRLDSICDSVYDHSYPLMVDSIKKLRQEEVIRLLEE